MLKLVRIGNPASELAGMGERVSMATVIAATRTAGLVADAVRQEIRTAFDRPTAYTLGAIGVIPADRRYNPSARVVIKDAAGYLDPQMHGGGRIDKRFEKMLRAASILPADKQAVPGFAAKIDLYGNMDRGQLIAILSYFRVFSVSGFTANRRADGKSRGVYRSEDWVAVNQQRPGLKPGIYQRDRRTGRLLCVIAFVKKPSYSIRFIPQPIADRVAAEQFPVQLRLALSQDR